MTDGECRNCGGGTFVLAKVCAHCGAPLRLRTAGLLIAGALVLLLVAIVVAAVAVLGGHRLATATETGAAADARIAAGSTADPSWLATAMSGCDAQARTDLGVLHFLVTPLVAVTPDTAPWRAKSINETGNAVLLRSDDTLDGLKRGTLRIYPADYAFSISDRAGNTVYKWRAAAGVAKFSTAEAGSISTFNVGFRAARSGADAKWGGSFARHDDSCYWVNAIIGN
jgi:hypothetical protein